ncbi:hypothetical protein [Pandoravirus japonicus]|uniref:Uncharacterized protein n=1 Tax=Pandoravirus japonicus TaxID=2823154 RepID=A0A811BP95_9VIRU|nr:hypothetical protein [Pandoravirus japonicus]
MASLFFFFPFLFSLPLALSSSAGAVRFALSMAGCCARADDGRPSPSAPRHPEALSAASLLFFSVVHPFSLFFSPLQPMRKKRGHGRRAVFHLIRLLGFCSASRPLLFSIAKKKKRTSVRAMHTPKGSRIAKE